MTERFKSEITFIAVYITRWNGILRNKKLAAVAAIKKLTNDINKYRNFEVTNWQIKAMGLIIHEYYCEVCAFFIKIILLHEEKTVLKKNEFFTAVNILDEKQARITENTADIIFSQ